MMIYVSFFPLQMICQLTFPGVTTLLISRPLRIVALGVSLLLSILMPLVAFGGFNRILLSVINLIDFGFGHGILLLLPVLYCSTRCLCEQILCQFLMVIEVFNLVFCAIEAILASQL